MRPPQKHSDKFPVRRIPAPFLAIRFAPFAEFLPYPAFKDSPSKIASFGQRLPKRPLATAPVAKSVKTTKCPSKRDFSPYSRIAKYHTFRRKTENILKNSP